MLFLRFLVSVLILTMLSPFVLAEEEFSDLTEIQEPDQKVPIMTFRQQVDCVTTIRQHPAVLQATIDQKENVIDTALVIRNDQNRVHAKERAIDFIRLIKRKSLDQDPNKETLGTGLYTYKVEVTRADKTVLATGLKRSDEEKITWAIDDEGNQDASMSADESLR